MKLDPNTLPAALVGRTIRDVWASNPDGRQGMFKLTLIFDDGSQVEVDSEDEDNDLRIYQKS